MNFEHLLHLSKGLNEHGTTISILLFIVTIFIGWVTGFFGRIANKPKFKIELLPGPTFICTFDTGSQFNGTAEHKTACAIYLRVSNIGAAASSISNVEIGYKTELWQSLFGWQWFKNLTVALDDFTIELDNKNMKSYPNLFQINSRTGKSAKTYLLAGQQTNGVAYFEDEPAW
ncbi:MAG TPA: hypothetical protein EYG79_01990, partial [Rhodobacteraceae bacterium]|nr:hypothetical protein [Paracoccaceae bacterium]